MEIVWISLKEPVKGDFFNFEKKKVYIFSAYNSITTF